MIIYNFTPQIYRLLFIYKNNSVHLWCKVIYNHLYNTFLFSGYMSLAGDNPDLKKFIVSLRSRMLRYDLTCLCLYLAMSMAINGGIILSEQDLLDALIL